MPGVLIMRASRIRLGVSGHAAGPRTPCPIRLRSCARGTRLQRPHQLPAGTPARKQGIMTTTRPATTFVAAAITVLATAATMAAAAPALARATPRDEPAVLRVTHTIPVPQFPYLVAVDPRTDTVYVIQIFANAVTVISGRENKVTATIPVGSHPLGIAVNPQTDTVYVANTYDHTVSVISGRTNTVVATIPVTWAPLAIAVNPRTDTIYAANDSQGPQPGDVAVISGRTNTVIATIPARGT